MDFDGMTFNRVTDHPECWVSDHLCRGTTALEDAMLSEIERLRAELAAWRSALAKVGPYYIPATNVSDEEAEEVYAAIDAARKGEGE